LCYLVYIIARSSVLAVDVLQVSVLNPDIVLQAVTIGSVHAVVSVLPDDILGSAGLDSSQVEVLSADGRLEVATLNLELSQCHIRQHTPQLHQF